MHAVTHTRSELTTNRNKMHDLQHFSKIIDAQQMRLCFVPVYARMLCVCACVSLNVVCVCVCARARACVCVRVCVSMCMPECCV
jgi:hypothetical protein